MPKRARGSGSGGYRTESREWEDVDRNRARRTWGDSDTDEYDFLGPPVDDSSDEEGGDGGSSQSSTEDEAGSDGGVEGFPAPDESDDEKKKENRKEGEQENPATPTNANGNNTETKECVQLKDVYNAKPLERPPSTALDSGGYLCKAKKKQRS